MKKLLVFIGVLLSISTYGQSVSASKIISFLESQSKTEITQKLKDLGFTYKGESELAGNFKEYTFYTTSEYGTELINIGQNDELFSVVYKLANSNFFNSLKEKLLTSKFEYSYSYKNNKYYESSNMRIGINIKNNILSFFVALK